ncbi:Signal recognition particle 14 kDa protein [Trichoplax sp. H2]|nr:Signal recognition particle 14 kDa protein [Trichoplax sp. H2]|eukprot:RDD42622.1 Signal recognition particle 14 kDa protein [Trichoplax sp. H2]
MVLLKSYDSFLSELTKLFEETRNKNSLFVTIKRYDGRTKPKSCKGDKNESTGDNKCLIRATNGKRKVSYVIVSKELNKFQLAYASVIKGNIVGLKKKDKRIGRTKGKKTMATQ